MRDTGAAGRKQAGPTGVTACTIYLASVHGSGPYLGTLATDGFLGSRKVWVCQHVPFPSSKACGGRADLCLSAAVCRFLSPLGASSWRPTPKSRLLQPPHRACASSAFMLALLLAPSAWTGSEDARHLPDDRAQAELPTSVLPFSLAEFFARCMPRRARTSESQTSRAITARMPQRAGASRQVCCSHV